MKKIVSLVLAISMVLSMFVSAFAATASFEDVTNTKYAGSVEALVELGVINGLPDGTYGPEKQVTRAELAKMLVICLGLGDTVESLAGRTIFTDVAENHWASGYINAAVQTKVIAGYPDGTFKPEKEVTYAEAVTMVIRALGYGNVVDTEGTWPTAYMLKAVELELLNDMDSPKAGEAALRGNVAILLWNMLRTPMWKITSENEGTGMTSTADALMLNVKFPNYRYVEDVTVASVSIDDEAKVTVELDLGYKATDTANTNVTVEGEVKDIDLPRVLVGMTVSSLIKNYKDAEEAEILTLTPKYALVEGLITDDATEEKVEIEDVEYKIVDLGEAANATLVSGDTYVVAEVNGKKVTAMKVLPVDNTEEVEKLKAMENDIDEDALVIIDGVWSTRGDIEVGDVWTELTTDDGSKYYMVARERVEGTFESLTREKDDDRRVYFEVDGEEYRAFEGKVEVFDGEENDDKVALTLLEKEEKDNKYLDQDVELVLNYLGQVVTVYFGEVSDLEAAGDFYVVMSNGVWTSSTSAGKQYHIVLAGVDGEEETYDFTKNPEYAEEVEEDKVYASGEARFVWANIDDNGLVKKVVLLENGLVSGEDYKGDYAFVDFSGEIEEKYLAGVDGNDYKVGSSTIVMTATPIEDEDEKVIGFELEVTEGPDALEGVTEGLIAYDVENPVRAKYVFVTEDAKSQDLLFGKVEKARQSRGVVYATISGTEYAVDLEESEAAYNTFAKIEALDKMLVAFTENNDKIEIKRHVVPADMDGMAWVEEVDDELVTISGDVNYGLNGTYDVEDKEDKEKFEEYTFVLVSAYEDKDGYVAYDSEVENLGRGLENASMKKGDRLAIDKTLEVVVIVRGFDVEDSFTNGLITYGE